MSMHPRNVHAKEGAQGSEANEKGCNRPGADRGTISSQTDGVGPGLGTAVMSESIAWKPNVHDGVLFLAGCDFGELLDQSVESVGCLHVQMRTETPKHFES